MQDKPLDRGECDLLAVLHRLEGERGPVTQAALSVETRGRGLEFGRSFARLKSLALIEEVERRPFVLLRLFGAKSIFVLRLTQAGRKLVAELAVASAEPVQPVLSFADGAVQPGEVMAPVAGVLADTSGGEPGAASADATPPMVEASAAKDMTGAGVVLPDPMSAQLDAITSVPDPAFDQTAPAQDLVLSVPVPAPKPLRHPVTQPEPQPQKPALKPAIPPRRLAPGAFTDVLGGAPLASDAGPLRATADAEAITALREVLSGLGIDLTMAGEMLACDRMAKGSTAAEALSQVVVYAFAHVVHHDLLHGRNVEALGLGDYAIEIRRELQKLYDAGEIGAARFDADMAQLATLINDATARGALAETLLRDPVGGAAPPAVLPEDLRQGHDA